MDLNVDAGEGGGDDAGLMARATSVNVACGFHAGDAPTMATTVAAAVRAGCAVGAHPSHPDREGFGRRPMNREPRDVAADVLYQVGALAALCRAAGTRLHHCKPHGALYHALWRDAALAAAVAGAIAAVDPSLWVYTPPGSALETAARRQGLRVAREGFADRGVTAEGGLVGRQEPGAVLTDPGSAAARALSWVREGLVAPADGGPALSWGIDSLCVHSDTPGGAAVLTAVRAALLDAGVPLAAP